MQQPLEATAFKVVLVGDSGVGKSSICMRYVQSFVYESQKNHGVVKNYNATIKVDNCIINLGIWDITAKPQYKQIRSMAYAGADAFIIVFSVDDRQSFQNAIGEWLNEVRYCCPQASVIFVGNKTDLRFSLDQITSDGNQLLQQSSLYSQVQNIKQYKYVECSAINYDGLTDVFIKCAKQILADQKRQKRRKKKYKILQSCNNCCIM